MTPIDPFPTPGSWREPSVASAAAANPPLSHEACLQLLAGLPPWRLGGSHAELVRTLRFPSRLSAIFFVGIITDFARELGTEPWLDVRGRTVTVHIGQPSVRPLTRRDFELARKISLIEEPPKPELSLKVGPEPESETNPETPGDRS